MTDEQFIPLFYPVRTAEMETAAIDTIRSGQLGQGPIVDQFEQKFGEYVGRGNVVAMNDMTNSLAVALRLAGVKHGGKVATISFSCLATNSAICMVGAEPVWVDVDPATVSMCTFDLRVKLSGKKIDAVIVYCVAGYPADILEMISICKEFSVPLVVDCNNSIGAEVCGEAVGRYGEFAVYSLYPNRQINGIEGGVLICPSTEDAHAAKRLRRFGVDYTCFRDDRGEINPNADVPEIGLSASWSQLNAAVALSQLPTLPERLERIKINAKEFAGLLDAQFGVRVVLPTRNALPAYWCFLILADRRDGLMSYLKRKGISCSVLHQRNDVYSGFSSESCVLTGTAYLMEHLLALPCGWWIGSAEIRRMANVIAEYYEGRVVA